METQGVFFLVLQFVTGGLSRLDGRWKNFTPWKIHILIHFEPKHGVGLFRWFSFSKKE